MPRSVEIVEAKKKSDAIQPPGFLLAFFHRHLRPWNRGGTGGGEVLPQSPPPRQVSRVRLREATIVFPVTYRIYSPTCEVLRPSPTGTCCCGTCILQAIVSFKSQPYPPLFDSELYLATPPHLATAPVSPHFFFLRADPAATTQIIWADFSFS